MLLISSLSMSSVMRVASAVKSSQTVSVLEGKRVLITPLSFSLIGVSKLCGRGVGGRFSAVNRARSGLSIPSAG